MPSPLYEENTIFLERPLQVDHYPDLEVEHAYLPSCVKGQSLTGIPQMQPTQLPTYHQGQGIQNIGTSTYRICLQHLRP